MYHKPIRFHPGSFSALRSSETRFVNLSQEDTNGCTTAKAIAHFSFDIAMSAMEFNKPQQKTGPTSATAQGANANEANLANFGKAPIYFANLIWL